MTLRTVSSVYARSAATIFSRCSASAYINVEFTSERSYSRLMLHVSTSRPRRISSCLDVSRVVEHQTLNELRLIVRLVLHGHDLHHV